jgi:hypothetical protein
LDGVKDFLHRDPRVAVPNVNLTVVFDEIAKSGLLVKQRKFTGAVNNTLEKKETSSVSFLSFDSYAKFSLFTFFTFDPERTFLSIGPRSTFLPLETYFTFVALDTGTIGTTWEDSFLYVDPVVSIVVN